MKNTIKLFNLFIFIILFNSCNTDEIIIQDEKSTSGIDTKYYSSLKSGNTSILSFKDAELFLLTTEELKNQSNTYELEFKEKNANLSLKEVNQKDRDINFDEYYIYKKFEKEHEFESLIGDYIAYENEWLTHKELNHKKCPSIYFNDLEEEQLSLLNKDYAVVIGESIYKIMKGGTVEIVDGNFDTLMELNAFISISEINEKEYNNIKIHYSEDYLNTESKSSCDWRETRSSSWVFPNNYDDYDNNTYLIRYTSKFKRYYDVSTLGRNIMFKSTTKSYVWTGSRWERHRVARLKAGFEGFYDIANTSSACGLRNLSYNRESNYNPSWNSYKVEYLDEFYLDEWYGWHAYVEEGGVLKSYHQLILTPGGHQYVRLLNSN